MTKEEIEHWFITLSKYKSWAESLGEEYDPKKDYAGPENSKTISFFIPCTAYKINVNPCFYGHDGDYSIGGSKKDRWQADVNMLATALFIIEKWPISKWIFGFNWARKGLARRRMIKYFEAVRAGGKKHFTFKVS